MKEMEAYEIEENIYRIPGGFGKAGEAFGGMLILDQPSILIGASGGEKFLRNLKYIITRESVSHDFRIYLPAVTWQELDTLEFIQKEYPQATIHVHESIVAKVQQPRKKFLMDRFGTLNEEAAEYYSKKLPKKLDNIYGINKSSTFQAKTTKIMIVPYQGPHEGHVFIYSSLHKVLCTGIALGISTTNPSIYYMDQTGSISNYKTSLSFLKKITANIVAPAYGEPQRVSTTSVDTIPIETAIERDLDAVYDLCTLSAKLLEEIVFEYRKLYGADIASPPFDRIKFEVPIVMKNLKLLVSDGKVMQVKGKYKRVPK
jgi:glyoxylase-like metal-dependent hydrolase (beta-lactamase superfamily II)